MTNPKTPPEDDLAYELAYELALMDTVEALHIKDSDTSDVIMQKLGTLFETKD